MFHALIFNTFGGMGRDWGETVRKVYTVLFLIRTRLRFALLRSVVTALRGVRGKKSGSGMKDLANVNFDFVPEGELYESY